MAPGLNGLNKREAQPLSSDGSSSLLTAPGLDSLLRREVMTKLAGCTCIPIGPRFGACVLARNGWQMMTSPGMAVT